MNPLTPKTEDAINEAKILIVTRNAERKYADILEKFVAPDGEALLRMLAAAGVEKSSGRPDHEN
jgi:hypothetical protein